MCTIYNKKVSWTIDGEFIEKINKHLVKDKNEIAGKILFTDYDCQNNICDKKISNYKISEGNGSSVYTPYGIINYHTHPKKCYTDEDAVFGWPSGEDMRQCLSFADKNNLVHIVFTMEGAYIIKVLNIIDNKHRGIMEDILKYTHIFRSSDQSNQLEKFKKYMKPIKKINNNNTVKIWLDLINNLNLKQIYILNNYLNNKNLKIPNDNNKIFNVELKKYNKSLKFNANYISEKCHLKNYKK
tara:strand:- start:429 stop:1151 length:723 start_codon:yes stop_codon:yes gene_type:complete